MAASRAPDPDVRLSAPAASRNRAPIGEVLRNWLPASGLVLEVASGSGEHAVWFSAAHPGLTWRPTDCDPAALASIAARVADAARPNLLAPLRLDAAAPESWPVDRADAIIAVNMIHIAPWPAAMGLLSGAGRVLRAGGRLILYGPFLEADVATAPSNLAFDADLRARDPAWGLRDLGQVTAAARQCGLDVAARVALPANNLCLVLRRR